MRRLASSVAQDIVMAAWRLDHVPNSDRSAGSMVRLDPKLSHATLSHADKAEATELQHAASPCGGHR